MNKRPEKALLNRGVCYVVATICEFFLPLVFLPLLFSVLSFIPPISPPCDIVPMSERLSPSALIRVELLAD